jgi:hypothetical protein
MKKYKIRNLGTTYVLTIPKVLVTQRMIEKGVTIEVLDYKPDEMLIKVRVADDGNREHAENSGESRADAQELGTSDCVQQAD